MPKLTKKTISQGHTDGPYLIIEKLHLKKYNQMTIDVKLRGRNDNHVTRMTK